MVCLQPPRRRNAPGYVQPFTQNVRDSVSALGEEKLIARIRRWLGTVSPRAPFGIGDDCAVLPGVRGRQLITVDPVIYGRHFDATVPPRAAGAKLLKRNLSDLAAMGGRPTAAVLSLILDARVSLTWLEQFYRGLGACARRYRVPIVGGDVAQADGILAASLTLLGQAAGPRVVARTGARPGDWIHVTGVLGGSLRSGHHFRFRPRLSEGAWLARQGIGTRRKSRGNLVVAAQEHAQSSTPEQTGGYQPGQLGSVHHDVEVVCVQGEVRSFRPSG